MNDSDFITVFDANQLGYRDWWVPAFGLIFVGVGLLLPKLINSGIFPASPQKRIWFPRLFLGFAVFWTLMAFLITFGSYFSGRETLISGQASYVEGQVQNFIPMPYSGHAMESFTVNGVPFCYSDYVITGGFNQTASHGGPIRSEKFVRIWYKGNDILKIQIPKADLPLETKSLPASSKPPAVPFPMFFGLWTALGIGSWALIAWLPTPQAKKRWSDRISVVAGIIFFVFVYNQIGPTQGNVIWFMGPAIALITILNIRNTYFCSQCGKRSVNRKWFGGTYSCPSCGNKLK